MDQKLISAIQINQQIAPLLFPSLTIPSNISEINSFFNLVSGYFEQSLGLVEAAESLASRLNYIKQSHSNLYENLVSTSSLLIKNADSFVSINVIKNNHLLLKTFDRNLFTMFNITMINGNSLGTGINKQTLILWAENCMNMHLAFVSKLEAFILDVEAIKINVDSLDKVASDFIPEIHGRKEIEGLIKTVNRGLFI